VTWRHLSQEKPCHFSPKILFLKMRRK